MLEAIQKITHKVRTEFCDSEKTYGGIQIPEVFNNNMQGLLQGNNSAPQMWSILSSIISVVLLEQ